MTSRVVSRPLTFPGNASPGLLPFALTVFVRTVPQLRELYTSFKFIGAPFYEACGVIERVCHILWYCSFYGTYTVVYNNFLRRAGRPYSGLLA